MSAIRIVGAEAVLVDATTIHRGDVLVQDGLIGGLDNPVGFVTPVDESVDATGCVVTAGLVNAHHHLLQSAFRTSPQTRFTPMGDWLAAMGSAYQTVGVDPELTYAAAAVGLAESLLGGVTLVADHHLTWPSNQDPVALAQATCRAAASVGSRLAFVRGTARDDPDFAATSIVDIHQAVLPGVPGGIGKDGMRQLAVGPSGVHADGRDTFAALREVAAQLGLRRRTQANEHIDVAVAAQKYGRRPIELLDEWGWLAADVTLAHLCDVTDSEIGRIAASGATATHAPGCDVPMGWGVAPVAALRAAGVRVGLGTSGGGSNDAGHLLADARLGMQVSGLIGAPVGAVDFLGMATEESAFGLGRSELGHLRVGASADLCIWDCSDVFDAGVADPVSGLLWANPGRRPRDVMIGGRWVVRGGELLTADTHQLAADLRTLVAARS